VFELLSHGLLLAADGCLGTPSQGPDVFVHIPSQSLLVLADEETHQRGGDE
jgi:hypothetical protein